MGWRVVPSSLLNSIVKRRDIEEVLASIGSDIVAHMAIGIDDDAVEAVGLAGVVVALPLAGLREIGAKSGVEFVAADGEQGHGAAAEDGRIDSEGHAGAVT